MSKDLWKISSDGTTAVSLQVCFLPMEDAPLGVKILALTRFKTCVQEVLSSEEQRNVYTGWFPFPAENKCLKT